MVASFFIGNLAGEVLNNLVMFLGWLLKRCIFVDVIKNVKEWILIHDMHICIPLGLL